MGKKEKTEKTKKPGKGLLIAICALVVFGILFNAAGIYFERILDIYVGKGEEHVVEIAGSENWDKEYYKSDYASAEDCDVFAKDVTYRIGTEGITLLKNTDEALPLKAEETKLSFFGRRSVDTVFGGTGSGSGSEGQAHSFTDVFTTAGYEINPKLTALYTDNLSKVPVQENSMDHFDGRTYYIGEFPQTYYKNDITGSYADYPDAAFIVIGRQGGEGMDFCTDLKASLTAGNTAMSASVEETKNYEDGQTQLELSKEEKDLIQHVTDNFDKVIVLVNSANVMELGELQNNDKIDAILWISYPGSRGLEALADIVSGKVTPSGRTVDTWVADLTADPSFQNAVSQKYVNVSSDNALADSYTLDYEEGIYVGYRYYETVAADGGTFTVEGQDGQSYEDAVVYPFGYGLSYASFEQSIESVEEAADGTITVTALVKNTQPDGGCSGKDVVQLYYSAPYTQGGLEKSAIVLAAFGKSEILAPGQEGKVVLTFHKEDMASYDYLNNRCYVLDAGDYILSLRKNAHELYGDNCEYTINVAQTVVFDESNPRQAEKTAQKGELVNLSQEAKDAAPVQAATNRFDYVSQRFTSYKEAEEGKAVNFSREDFAASFPKAPTEADLTASEEVIKELGPYTPDYYDDSEPVYKTGEDYGLSVLSLRGAPYDDPMWEQLLDQLTPKKMSEFIYAGNQGTTPLKNIGLPASDATDGPAGLKQYGGLGASTSGNFNCSSTLLAGTWNVALAQDYGLSVASEALIANKNGWYAPGLDMHRTPFGGRNFEYYSEDPVISGMMCAYTVQGCAEKGLVTYFKHFALNDTDSHRIDNGFCTWVNEQAMREIYLKAYEIAMEVPVMELKYLSPTGEVQYKTMRASTAVMSSFNRIGATWAGASPALLKDVLRGEWGFLGTVITDYNGYPFMFVEKGVLSGNDLMLANTATIPTKFADPKNNSTIGIMRQAVKNVAYTLVNSNTVNGKSATTIVTYDMSPWKKIVYIIDGVLVAAIIVLLILFLRKRKKKVTMEIKDVQ